MQRLVSVRYDGVLGKSERDAITRAYLSAGASVTSWRTTGSRSYATLRMPVAAALPAALAVLRVTPDAPRLRDPLLAAFAGPGGPAGVADAYRDGDSIVIEFDPRRSPLALMVAAIDAELGAAPGRAIEPLVPLDDETLAAYAGFVLGEAALDASRLIETYSEPLLATGQ